MVKKVSAFACEICQAVYAKIEDAKNCESQGKPKMRGLEVNDMVKFRYVGREMSGRIDHIEIHPPGHHCYLFIAAGTKLIRIEIADVIKKVA